MAHKRVTCDICGEPNWHKKAQRRKCRDCGKMMCALCRSNLNGPPSERCPKCNEQHFLDYIEPFEHKTSTDQIAIWYHGHRVWGVPLIGQWW